MIVKCQRSLVTTESTVQLLVYNRTRSRIVQRPMTRLWNTRFGPTGSPEDNRFFAQVRWDAREGRAPIFVRKLPEQGW